MGVKLHIHYSKQILSWSNVRVCFVLPKEPIHEKQLDVRKLKDFESIFAALTRIILHMIKMERNTIFINKSVDQSCLQLVTDLGLNQEFCIWQYYIIGYR